MGWYTELLNLLVLVMVGVLLLGLASYLCLCLMWCLLYSCCFFDVFWTWMFAGFRWCTCLVVMWVFRVDVWFWFMVILPVFVCLACCLCACYCDCWCLLSCGLFCCSDVGFCLYGLFVWICGICLFVFVTLRSLLTGLWDMWF